MKFMELRSGVLLVVEREAVFLEHVGDQLVKEWLALIGPGLKDQAHHLASALGADGLNAVVKVANAYQDGGLDDAKKAAVLSLDIMGKDVTNLGHDELETALLAANAALKPVVKVPEQEPIIESEPQAAIEEAAPAANPIEPAANDAHLPAEETGATSAAAESQGDTHAS